MHRLHHTVPALVVSALVAATVVTVAPPSRAAATAPLAGTPAAVWAAVADPIYVRNLAEHPQRLVTGIGASGAVGVNRDWEAGRRSTFFIEEQRYGGDLAQAALLTGNDALLAQARTVIDWGFAHQAADGSFPGDGNPLHSTSFFVESVARTVLLAGHMNRAVPDWMSAWTPRLLASARWMASAAVRSRYFAGSVEPFTHRYFVQADALAETAQLTGDRDLAATAAQYVRAGIGKMTRDHVLPERGGFDVNYEMLSVLFLTRYLVVCTDPTLRRIEVPNVIRLLYPALAARVNADGTVDTSDSTRLPNEPSRGGGNKAYDYKTAVQAFALAASVASDQGWYALARRLARSQGWTE